MVVGKFLFNFYIIRYVFFFNYIRLSKIKTIDLRKVFCCFVLYGMFLMVKLAILNEVVEGFVGFLLDVFLGFIVGENLAIFARRGSS